MNRNHHEHKDISHTKNALTLSISATAAIFVIEVAGGLWTNSLALLSDAGHVFMDMFSLLLSFSAILLAERSSSDTRTFGWHRLEVFAALINALTVFFIAFVIFFHALKRISQPAEILAPEMLVLACLGLAVNLFVIWKLHPHMREDINVRSAFLHAFGDAAASLAVVGGGVLVILTGKHVVDPLAAILVAGIIILNAGGILKDSFHILLEGMPKGLKKETVVDAIEGISGKESVKDLHVWNLCSHICALSVHLTVPEGAMREQKNILEKVNLVLREKFNIVHTTVQIESEKW